MTPSSSDLSERLIAETQKCVAAIRAKWIEYITVLKFKPNVPLSEIIESFSIPIQEYVSRHHSILMTGPASHFWLMIFTAVLESKTHSADSVNQAIAELETKFAR